MNKIISTKSELIKGNDVLTCKRGTFLRVVNGPGIDCSGDVIVIRTCDNSNPFISLSNGALWGNVVDDYTFEVLKQGTILTIQVNN